MIVLGIAGLIIGLFGIFGSNITRQSPWALTLLGVVFLGMGIGLFRSTYAPGEEVTDYRPH